MKEFKVAVEWSLCGVVPVKANSLEEAIEKVKEDDSIPLPNGEYLDGSFSVNDDLEFQEYVQEH